MLHISTVKATICFHYAFIIFIILIGFLTFAYMQMRNICLFVRPFVLSVGSPYLEQNFKGYFFTNRRLCSFIFILKFTSTTHFQCSVDPCHRISCISSPLLLRCPSKTHVVHQPLNTLRQILRMKMSKRIMVPNIRPFPVCP